MNQVEVPQLTQVSYCQHGKKLLSNLQKGMRIARPLNVVSAQMLGYFFVTVSEVHCNVPLFQTGTLVLSPIDASGVKRIRKCPLG